MGSWVKNFRFGGDGSQISVWWKWVLNLVWGQIVKDWLHRKSYNDPKIILTCKLSWESLMGRFRKEFLACQGPAQLLYAIFLQNIIFLKKMWFLENTLKIRLESTFWATWMGMKWRNSFQWLSGPKKSFLFTFTE